MVSQDGRVWYTVEEMRRRLREANETERAWMEAFLQELRRGKTVRVSCDLAGVPYSTAYHCRHTVRAFRVAWDRALAEALIGHPLPLAS
jgi:hypothetical protein